MPCRMTNPAPGHPALSSNDHAQVHRTHNGSTSTILAVLAQLALNAGAGSGTGVEGLWLVANLGGNNEGKEVIQGAE